METHENLIRTTMDTFERIECLKRMDQMIRFQKTGSPDEFAEYMGLAKRTLYTYLKELKERGAEIKFNKFLNSYEYLNDFHLSL